MKLTPVGLCLLAAASPAEAYGQGKFGKLSPKNRMQMFRNFRGRGPQFRGAGGKISKPAAGFRSRIMGLRKNIGGFSPPSKLAGPKPIFKEC